LAWRSTAVVVAVLFLACLFFAPLTGSIPAYATAAAILYVARLMVWPLVGVNWREVTDATPYPVFTVGHSNHLPETFVQLLPRHDVAEGVDVR